MSTDAVDEADDVDMPAEEAEVVVTGPLRKKAKLQTETPTDAPKPEQEKPKSKGKEAKEKAKKETATPKGKGKEAKAQAKETANPMGKGKEAKAQAKKSAATAKAKANAKAQAKKSAAPKPEQEQGAAGAEKPTERHSAEAKANKAAYSALSYQLSKKNPQKAAEYKALSFGQKQVWLQKFKLDPALAWLEAETTTAVGTDENNMTNIEWITVDQLGGPLYLNNMTHAETIMKSGLLETRPHELKPLADIGIQQLKWSKNWKTLSDFTRELTKVKATGKMNEEDYSKVRDAMLNGSGQPKPTPTPQKDKTPEAKQAEEARRAKTKLLQAAQSAITKHAGFISEAIMQPIYKKLASRPWGASAIPEIKAKVADIDVAIKSLHQQWSDDTLKVKTNPKDSIGKDLADKIKALEKLWSCLDASYISDAKNMK